MKTANCKICDSQYHTKSWHTVKERKPMNRGTSTLKTTKPMKQRGKIAKTWAKTRTEWFKQNPADIYHCYYCKTPMTKAETTLDHKLSRTRRPDLRFDLDNLVPCCWRENQLKGSRSAEEYLGN